MSSGNLFKLDIHAPQAAVWVRPSDFGELALIRPVCLVNGAFDLLHTGHLKLLRTARERCATLVVGLDSDMKIRNEKGDGRPIMSFVERAVNLDYLGINYISEIDSLEDMLALLTSLQPDFRILGEDHSKTTRFPSIPRFFIPRTPTGPSTTDLIARCQGKK